MAVGKVEAVGKAGAAEVLVKERTAAVLVQMVVELELEVTVWFALVLQVQWVQLEQCFQTRRALKIELAYLVTIQKCQTK